MIEIQPIISACWTIFVIFWVATAFTNKHTVQRQPFKDRLWYGIWLFLSFWLLANGFDWTAHGKQFSQPIYPLHVPILPHSSIVVVIGVACTVVGLLLALWARVTLGRNWSGSVTFKEEHELVENGPYAWVRHPIYTALLLMFLGTAMDAGSLGAFLGLVAMFISFWIKLKQEEGIMTEHFGEAYPEYKVRVKALIPFLF